MKINAKMLVYILSTSMLIFIAALGYITWKSGELTLDEAREVANKNAHEYANVIKSELASDFNVAKTLAQAGQAYQSISWNEFNKAFLEQQLNVINENPHYLAVTASWELNYIDPSRTKNFGRYLNGWVRNEEGKISQIETKLNTDGDVFSSNYYKMKSTGTPMIVDPKLYSPTGKAEDQYIKCNISAPIILGKTFIGLAGIDIDLLSFQEEVEKIKPFKNSYAFLISFDGTIVAHPDSRRMGKLFSKEFPSLTEKYSIIEKVQSGVNFSFTYRNENNDKFFFVFAPIKMKETDTPWSLAIVVPNSVITSKAHNILYNALFVGFIGLILLIIFISIIARNISNPIIKITNTLKSLALGKIDHSLVMNIQSKDEIGEMTVALNTSIIGLNKKTEFANHIGTGNIETELELLSNEDELGKSLLNMQDSLRKAKKEEDERKLEDQNRQWTNEGLAKFAELLRQNNDNISALSHDIIKNLVHYLDANQGGLFIKNDLEQSEVIFDLVAAFAFDREKYIQKSVELGEGLVGSCAREKETIYLTEIPQNYVQIVSGLGGANPNSLLLVPLKFENDVLGVIELASFNQFKEHEIIFVEKVAESIASVIKSVGINIKTSQLLEQSQQQAEEMAAQEEEMRQNMEELQATQEESTRKGEELRGMLDAMDYFLLKAEFDLNATLINANDLFLNKFAYTMKNAYGMEIEEFVADRNMTKFQNILNKVMSGNSHQEITYLKTKKGKELKLITSFTPVMVGEELNKILLLAIDITDFK